MLLPDTYLHLREEKLIVKLPCVSYSSWLTSFCGRDLSVPENVRAVVGKDAHHCAGDTLE